MQERIRNIFKKFLSNTGSKEEFDELFLFIKKAESDSEIRTLLDATLETSEAKNNNPGRINEGLIQSCETDYSLHNRSAVRRMVNSRNRKILGYCAVACTILVLVWAWMNYSGRPNGQPAELTRATIKRATEKSQYRHLLLPDSTEVWLNAASELEFPKYFPNDKREVKLTGEAFFDVKHADKIPFVIHTGKVSTVVLGTAFNIKAYPDMDKITVSVKRGIVQVKYVDRPVAMLRVGEQVSITVNDSSVNAKKLNEAEVSAWQQGKLVYDDDKISDITKDLERVFNTRILVNNPIVSDTRVSTAFIRDKGLENALEVLCRLTESKWRKENNFYTVK